MAIDITQIQTFSASDLLALTNNAIAQITLGGQAVGQNGRQLTRADLSALYEQREKLQLEVARESATGGMFAAGQFRKTE